MQFVNDLEECVCEQQNEVNKATIGLGRWSLSPPYSHLRQDAGCWLKSVDRLPLLCPTLPVDESTNQEINTTSLFDQSTSRDNLAKDVHIDFDKCLSVPLTSITHSLSEGLAKAIWKKAFYLLKDEKVIKVLDKSPTTRWVSSDTQLSPHVTTAKANPHRYLCDKFCVGWKTQNICAHCVAAAQDNNELKEFLTWFLTSKGEKCNLTEAVYHNTYKHAGLKKPRTKRKYGDASHLPTEQKSDRLALNNISNRMENPDNNIAFSNVPELKAENLDDTQKVNTIPGSVAKQPQLISGNGTGLGNNIQVCFTAQNVSFCTRLEPQVTTAITTPLTSIFSQLSFPLLVQSLTSAGSTTPHASMQSILQSLTSPKPLTSGISQLNMPSQQSTPGTPTYNASMQSILQSLTSPKPLTSGISQLNMPSQQSTPGTPTYNGKPANTKSDRPFFLTLLTNRIKKCSGCHALFQDNNGQVPTFILGHMERDWYPQDGQWNLGKLQNKYYHLSKNCIHSRCGLYKFPNDLATLQLPTEEVPPTVQDTIRKEFGLEV